MPPAAINIDSLINALSNSVVLEAIGKILQPMLQLTIDEALKTQLNELNGNIAQLSTELQKRDDTVKKLEGENQVLQSRFLKQAAQLEALEAYSRADNILVYGITESYAEASSHNSGPAASQLSVESLTQMENSTQSELVFLQFCQSKLNVDIHAQDISICHRLKKSHGSHQGRPLIVRFTNQKARSRILSAKKQLKGSNIYINEHLTKQASSLYAEARTKVKTKKISNAWTRNGRIHIKLLDGNIAAVNSVNELDQY